MKTATLLRFSLTLPVLLAACGGLTGPTAVVGMTPSLQGADIRSTLTVARDAGGAVTGLRISQLSQAPTLRVVVAPSSLGVTFTKAEVSVVDAAGVVFSNTFTQSFGERVPSGYACAAKAGDAFPVVPLSDQCAASLKLPYQRTVDVASLPLIDATTSAQFADEFFANYTSASPCPDLSLNVTLYGYDDLNRNIKPMVIRNAPIAETCNIQ